MRRGLAHFATRRVPTRCVLIALLWLVAACSEQEAPAGPASTGRGGATAPGIARGTATGAAAGRWPGQLPDVAAQAGIDFVHTHGGNRKKFLFETMGSGVAAADFDADGRPDLLFLQSGTLPPDEFSEGELKRAGHAAGQGARLYRNLGGMRFEDISAGSGLEQPRYDMGLAVGDVDADGDRDVYVASYGRDRLFANDGKARFQDRTEAAGLDETRWTIGGAFFDADLDGDLDLYSLAYLDMPISAHQFCGPSNKLRTYCHVDTWAGLDDVLWINDGTGAFTDGSEAAGLRGTAGKALSVVGGDYDDDGDVDLFVANDSTANLMLRNEGEGRFTNVGRMSGTDLNAEGRTEACMGTDMGDLDGDGDLDMYVINFQQETNTLYRNEGNGFFTDVSMVSGTGAPSTDFLGFGTAFLDVENDGDLDIYVANGHIDDCIEEIDASNRYAQPDQLYLGDGRGRFSLADTDTGPSLSVPRVGRGLARSDLDGDGDQDLVVTNSNQAPWLLRNDVATGASIALRLGGANGSADAIGARVQVTAGGRTLVRELHPGGSYLSHNDTELVVGLDAATQVDKLVIRWPGGALSEHSDLAVGRRYWFEYGGRLLREEPFERR